MFLDISNFLEEISSFSHSIVFLYFFAMFIKKRPSYLSLLFYGALHSAGCIFPFLPCLSYLFLLFFRTLLSVGCIFPFLPCLSLVFFPQLFVKPPQTTTLFLHFFCFGMVLVTTSYIVLQTSVHSSSGILSTRPNPLNLFITYIV